MATDSPRRFSLRMIALGVIAVAVTLRAAAMYAQYDSLSADPDGYRGIAQLLWETGEYRRPVAYQIDGSADNSIVTAYRPPLYPLLLAAIGWGGNPSNMAVAVLHLLLGVGTVGMVYALAVRWLEPSPNVRWWAALAGLLVAADPILLRQASVTMTETLATFLATLSLLALTWHEQRRHWVSASLAGGAIGLACLCRPTFLPWMALVALAYMVGWLRERNSGTDIPVRQEAPARERPTGICVLLFIACAGAALLPWIARNYLQFGRPIVATTHGGYTLLLANNPEFYALLREGDGEKLFDAEGSQMGADYRRIEREHAGDELGIDRWANREARKSIVAAPGDFAYATLVRTARFWQLMPHKRREGVAVSQSSESTKSYLVRLAIGVWYTCLFMAAAAGAIFLRGKLFRSPWLWGLLLVASLTVVHAIYWSNMRMRAPVMPVVVLLSVYGLSRGTRLYRS